MAEWRDVKNSETKSADFGISAISGAIIIIIDCKIIPGVWYCLYLLSDKHNQ